MAEIELESEGMPSYHPRVLLSVWLYGFVVGVRSSRKLETAFHLRTLARLWRSGDPVARHRLTTALAPG